MKKILLTAAAISTLISSSVFAAESASDADFYVNLGGELSWVLPGNFLNSSPNNEKSDNKKYSQGFFSLWGVNLGAGYNVNDQFSLGLLAGFKGISIKAKSSLQDAFDIKYASSVVDMGNLQKMIGEFATLAPTESAKDSDNKDKKDNKDNSTSVFTTEQAKQLSNDLKSKEIATAKFDLKMIPLTLNANWSFVNIGNVKFSVGGLLGMGFVMPKSSLQVSFKELSEALNSDNSKEKKSAMQAVVQKYKKLDSDFEKFEKAKNEARKSFDEAGRKWDTAYDAGGNNVVKEQLETINDKEINKITDTDTINLPGAGNTTYVIDGSVAAKIAAEMAKQEDQRVDIGDASSDNAVKIPKAVYASSYKAYAPGKVDNKTRKDVVKTAEEAFQKAEKAFKEEEGKERASSLTRAVLAEFENISKDAAVNNIDLDITYKTQFVLVGGVRLGVAYEIGNFAILGGANFMYNGTVSDLKVKSVSSSAKEGDSSFKKVTENIKEDTEVKVGDSNHMFSLGANLGLSVSF